MFLLPHMVLGLHFVGQLVSLLTLAPASALELGACAARKKFHLHIPMCLQTPMSLCTFLEALTAWLAWFVHPRCVQKAKASHGDAYDSDIYASRWTLNSTVTCFVGEHGLCTESSVPWCAHVSCSEDWAQNGACTRKVAHSSGRVALVFIRRHR